MRRTTLVAVAVAVAFVVMLIAGVARADPGSLDPFFSHDGIQTAFPNGGVAYAVASTPRNRSKKFHRPFAAGATANTLSA